MIESVLIVVVFLLGIGGVAVFFVLLRRVGRNVTLGDRRNPDATILILMYPFGLWRWLGEIIDRSRGSEAHRTELALARLCRALNVAFFVLAALVLLLGSR